MSTTRGKEILWQQLRDLNVEENRRGRLKALTKNQEIYLEAVRSSTVTICVGPAGTGKTYMACGMAAQMLQEGRINRIVLTRPLVSCGFGYGFRPGTVFEKVSPDMRPMMEALSEFLGQREFDKLVEDKVVELWPLDDMRGANIPKTFIICDESQNALYGQLHMLLTRFAQGSKVVLCGDDSSTQTDLRHQGENPLRQIIRRFSRTDKPAEISVVRLGRTDIVRHPLIQWIDEALSGSGVKQEGEGGWWDLHCPGCRAHLWYDDLNEVVDRVRCYNCQALINLWSGEDDWLPTLTTEKGHAVATHPERP